MVPLSKLVLIASFGYLPATSVCWYHIQITFVLKQRGRHWVFGLHHPVLLLLAHREKDQCDPAPVHLQLDDPLVEHFQVFFRHNRHLHDP